MVGTVHVQRGSDQLRGSSSGAGESAGPSFVVGLGASTVDQDFGQSPVMVGGGAGGVMVVAVPALNRGTEVARGSCLCGWRAPIVGLTSVKVLSGLVLRSQLQTGWLYPEYTPTLWGCVASGSRRMWERFRRWHEGFAGFADILSRNVKSFRPLVLPNLPPVLVSLLDQHVAFPLVDGNDAVLGLVFVVILHLYVDLARGNRQVCHDASDCPRGRSPPQEDVC